MLLYATVNLFLLIESHFPKISTQYNNDGIIIHFANAILLWVGKIFWISFICRSWQYVLPTI